MKSAYLAAALLALGVAACSKEAPPPAPAPKVEAPKPAAEAPKPAEAPVAAPASGTARGTAPAADAAKPAEAPKADAAPKK
jgi:hypothetical protein